MTSKRISVPNGLLGTILSFVLILSGCGGGSPNQVTGSNNQPPGSNNGGGNNGGGNTQTEVLYAAYATPNGGGAGGSVVPLSINGTTGALTPLNAVPGPGVAVTIAVDNTRHFLYSSDFNSSTVYAYSVDANTGSLTPLVGSPYSTGYSLFTNGGSLAVDPVGNFLFFTDSVGNIVTFLRHSDGTLVASSAPVAQDMNQPIQLVVDPSGKFLYASNHADYMGPVGGGQLSVFSIDVTTGALTPVTGSPFTFAQQNSEPWGIAMNPQGTYLFSALSLLNSVAALSVDGSSGAVTQVSGSPFPSGQRLPEQLVLSPSGKFLYVGNIGLSSISIYSVDEASGRLTPRGTDVSAADSVFAINPSETLLFSTCPFPAACTDINVWQINSSGDLSGPSSFPSPNNYPPSAMTAIALP